MGDLLEVEVDQIEAGENARTIDTESDEFAELVASIKDRGVLQPVLLRRGETEKFRLVAGERRWRAAVLAGMTKIPAQVRDDADFADTITENVQRSDLTLREEAVAVKRLMKEKGLNQAQVAAALNRSKAWVADRVRLNDLPEEIAVHFGADGAPLVVLGPISKIAKVGPRVAARLAEGVAEGRIPQRLLEPKNLYSSFDWLERLRDEAPENGDVPFFLYEFVRHGASSRHLPDEVGDELRDEAIEHLGYYVQWTDADVSAARAYGCLYEWKTTKGGGATRFILDAPEFLADRLKLKVEKAKKDRAKNEAKISEQSGQAKGEPQTEEERADAEAEAKAAEKERRAKERTKLLRAQVEAEQRNLELGSRLLTDLSRPKFSMEAAKLMAAVVIGQWEWALAAGYGYGSEECHEVEWGTRKADGEKTVKVTPDPAAAATALREEVEKAKTPNAVLGVILRAMIMASYRDDEMTPQSKRVPKPSFPFGVHDKLVAIAEEAGVLPEGLRK